MCNLADTDADCHNAVAAEVHFNAAVNSETCNYVAMTGPAVEQSTWQTFPAELAHCTSDWVPFEKLEMKQ